MLLIEKAFAALMLAVCLLLLLRMLLGERRRRRVDAALRHWTWRWQRRFGRWSRGPSGEARAAREADQVIERARRAAAAGEWDGNVYRRKSFTRKKRDLH